jgi:hypothetical protein
MEHLYPRHASPIMLLNGFIFNRSNEEFKENEYQIKLSIISKKQRSNIGGSSDGHRTVIRVR